MKRVFSFVLALSLVVGLMTGITLTASAEEEMPPVVESFSVTAEALEAGATPATAAGITLSTQNASITNVEWQEYSYADGYSVPMTTDTFQTGKVYMLLLSLTAAEDYLFDSANLENTTVSDGRLGWTSGNWDSTATVGIVYLPDGTQLIDSVSLTGVPAMAAGTSTDTSTISVPEGANYTLDHAVWEGHDSEYNYLDPLGDTLVEGNYYTLNVGLAPKEGYWFADEVTMNGAAVSSCYSNDWGSDCYINYECDLLPTIREVRLTGLTAAVLGQSASASAIKAPENAKYTVEVEYKALNGEAVDSVTFDYGYYDLNITLTAKEGYTFDMDFHGVYINELSIHELSEGYNWWVGDCFSSEDKICINLYAEIEPPKGYIEDFRLKGDVEEIEPGQTIAAPTVTYDPYEDMEDAMTVTKTEWVDAEHKAVTGKFEDGKKYYLAVTVKAAEGYGFRSGLQWIGLVNSNGRYINETRDYDYSFDTITVYFPYSLLPTVDEVALTVTEPAVGAAPSAVTVPSDAKYALNEDVGYNWYDYDSREEVEKFETNGKYGLYLSLVPADGYEWAEDVTVTINGEEIDSCWTEQDGSLWLEHTYSFKTQVERVDITMPIPTEGGTANIADIKVPADAAYEIDAENSGWELDYNTFSGTFEKGGNYRLRLYVNVKDSATTEFSEDCVVYLNGTAYDEDEYDIGYDGTRVYVYYTLDLREVISKLELPALPGEVKAGDAVPEGGEVTLPDGTNYMVMFNWGIYSEDNGMGEAGDTFETGKAYYLVYQIGTKEGYRFAEDLVITAGGKELTGVIKMIGDDEGAIAIMYPVGMKVIDKVELTVTEPVAGQKPGSVTIPKDATYSITYTGWTTSTEDNISDSDEMGKKEVFKVGNYYWVGVELKAAEGYVFASDVEVVVNGEAVDMAALIKEIGEGFYAMGDMAMAAGAFGQLTESTDNPKTGDNAPIALVAALGVLAAAGMAVVGLKKKEF